MPSAGPDWTVWRYRQPTRACNVPGGRLTHRRGIVPRAAIDLCSSIRLEDFANAQERPEHVGIMPIEASIAPEVLHQELRTKDVTAIKLRAQLHECLGRDGGHGKHGCGVVKHRGRLRVL